MEIEDFRNLSCFPDAEESQVLTVRGLYGRLSKSAPDSKPTLPELQELLQIPEVAPSLRVERVTRAGSPMGLGLALHTEDGLVLPTLALWQGYERPEEDVLIWIGNDKDEAAKCPAVRTALEKNRLVWAIDLPGLGEATLNSDMHGSLQRIRHNATRACHMLGFDLASLWLNLLRRAVTTVRENGAKSVTLIAHGGPGTIALLGAGLLQDVDRIFGGLALGLIPHGRHLRRTTHGNFHLQAGPFGRHTATGGSARSSRLTVAAPLGPRNEQLSLSQREKIFAPTREAYAQNGHPEHFRLIGPAEMQSGLGRWL